MQIGKAYAHFPSKLTVQQSSVRTTLYNLVLDSPFAAFSRDQYVLKMQQDLDKLTARGLDGDGLAPQGKAGRIYTFEVWLHVRLVLRI